MSPITAVQTPARRKKTPPLTRDGRVPGMRDDGATRIYNVGEYAQLGAYSWFRDSTRQGWIAHTELLGCSVFVDGVTDDFGAIVAVERIGGHA